MVNPLALAIEHPDTVGRAFEGFEYGRQIKGRNALAANGMAASTGDRNALAAVYEAAPQDAMKIQAAAGANAKSENAARMAKLGVVGNIVGALDRTAPERRGAALEQAKGAIARMFDNDPQIMSVLQGVTEDNYRFYGEALTDELTRLKQEKVGADIGLVGAKTADIGIDNARDTWRVGAGIADAARRTDIYSAGVYDQIGDRAADNARDQAKLDASAFGQLPKGQMIDPDAKPVMVGVQPEALGTTPPGPWQDAADPTRFMRDPKAKDRFYNQQATARTKQQEEEQAALVAAEKNARLADEFMALNEKTETGGGYRAPLVGGLISDVAAMADPNVARMEAINAELTPGMRIPGSGATSDFDAAMFQRSTLGIKNPKEANRAVAEGLKAREMLTRERNSFNEAYYSNVGHMNGAETAWQNYLNANPIFDPSSPDAPRINSHRQSWQQFFNAGGGEASPQGGVPLPPGLDASEGDEVTGPNGRTYIVRNGALVPK